MDIRFYIFSGIGASLTVAVLYGIQIFVNFHSDYVLAYLTLGVVGAGLFLDLYLYEIIPKRYHLLLGTIGWLSVVGMLFCYVNRVFLPSRFS
jgi:hypothetical protein